MPPWLPCMAWPCQPWPGSSADWVVCVLAPTERSLTTRGRGTHPSRYGWYTPPWSPHAAWPCRMGPIQGSSPARWVLAAWPCGRQRRLGPRHNAGRCAHTVSGGQRQRGPGRARAGWPRHGSAGRWPALAGFWAWGCYRAAAQTVRAIYFLQTFAGATAVLTFGSLSGRAGCRPGPGPCASGSCLVLLCPRRVASVPPEPPGGSRSRCRPVEGPARPLRGKPHWLRGKRYPLRGTARPLRGKRRRV